MPKADKNSADLQRDSRRYINQDGKEAHSGQRLSIMLSLYALTRNFVPLFPSAQGWLYELFFARPIKCSNTLELDKRICSFGMYPRQIPEINLHEDSGALRQASSEYDLAQRNTCVTRL